MLTSVLLAAALATPGVASAGANAAFDVRASSAAAAQEVVKRKVRLGHKPILLRTDTKAVRLTFRGRKGQFVNLGHWSLGPPMTAGRNHDVTHLVPVRLGSGERLAVDQWYVVNHVVLPDRTLSTGLKHRFVLEDGKTPGWRGGTSTPGRHFLAVDPGAEIRVHRALAHQATLDGPAVQLANQGIEEREHGVTFTATAGQWVYGELLTAGGDPATAFGISSVEALEPTGPELINGLPTGPWLVPATGTYRMSASVDRSAPDATFTLRVRAAAVAEPLTLNGPAVTYSATTPGQWVVGPYPDDLPDGVDTPVATASNASASLADWRLSLVAGFPTRCAPDQNHPACGEYSATLLTAAEMSGLVPPTFSWRANPAVVLLTVPHRVQGSVELTLRSR